MYFTNTCVCPTIGICLCLVSDLAPGQLGIDDMKMLEQKAQQLAAEAEQDKPKPKEKILFVRSVIHFSIQRNLAEESSIFYTFELKLAKEINSYAVFCILLCRSDTSRSELAELAKQANPDEIDIDDDDDEDEEGQGPDGE